MKSSQKAPGYITTFVDRLGPDGPLVVKSMVFAIALSPIAGVGGAALAIKNGASPKVIALSALLSTLIGGYLIFWVLKGIPEAGAQALAATLMPSGNTTPYATDYSYESALAMRGDVKGALASFEDKLSAEPSNVAVRLKAADMYALSGNPLRARDLYREVQRISGVAASDDIFASYRMIDLYRGKLGEPGKSLPEFRRLIEMYPGTQIAAQARDALANLKKEMTFD